MNMANLAGAPWRSPRGGHVAGVNQGVKNSSRFSDLDQSPLIKGEPGFSGRPTHRSHCSALSPAALEVLWYLHSEVVGHCPRKFGVTRILSAWAKACTSTLPIPSPKPEAMGPEAHRGKGSSRRLMFHFHDDFWVVYADGSLCRKPILGGVFFGCRAARATGCERDGCELRICG